MQSPKKKQEGDRVVTRKFGRMAALVSIFTVVALFSVLRLVPGVYRGWQRWKAPNIVNAHEHFQSFVEFQLNVDTGGFLGTYRL